MLLGGPESAARRENRMPRQVADSGRSPFRRQNSLGGLESSAQWALRHAVGARFVHPTGEAKSVRRWLAVVAGFFRRLDPRRPIELFLAGD